MSVKKIDNKTLKEALKYCASFTHECDDSCPLVRYINSQYDDNYFPFMECRPELLMLAAAQRIEELEVKEDDLK